MLCVFGLLLPGCGKRDFEFRSGAAVDQGLDPKAFAAFSQAVEKRNTDALLVIRNDRVLHEWYAKGIDPAQAFGIASVSKAVVGGLALALLLGDGRVALDEPVSAYVPEWASDAAKASITLRQLATHSSGLADAERAGGPHAELPGWQGAFWKREPERDKAKRKKPEHDQPNRNSIEIALRDAPLLFPPGQGFAYSNPGFAVLSHALSAALQKNASGQAGAVASDLRTLLRNRILRPIGISDSQWAIGYNQPFEIGDLIVWATWGGGNFSARALARIGRLLLRRGNWEGQRLLEPEALEAMVSYGGTPLAADAKVLAYPAPALGWWSNARGTWSAFPRDAFLAAGAGHQSLLVVPSLDLIVVRLGRTLAGQEWGADFWKVLDREFLQPLARAFPEPPVPWSNEIAGAWFDPISDVRCDAIGSDNWPVTWADDGHLYTAYGDGWGFEPRTDRKLSQGFARIEGGPNNFVGVNIRSPTGESEGDGPVAIKASGLLFVDETLYLWERNVGEAQLAWSPDRARTWKFGFRLPKNFGSPSFLNFGRDYSGARDDFVYVYSQDGASAYQVDDRILLARVPKRQIRKRKAYEFFAGTDSTGRPRWSKKFSERTGVFTYPGRCLRVEVVWNADLGRYVMALGFDFKGGWGLFAAPEPWGPWETLFFTHRWDQGDTHGYRLPTKWIEDQGRTLHLVYSGIDDSERVVDAFCTRSFRLLPLKTAFGQEP